MSGGLCLGTLLFFKYLLLPLLGFNGFKGFGVLAPEYRGFWLAEVKVEVWAWELWLWFVVEAICWVKFISDELVEEEDLDLPEGENVVEDEEYVIGGFEADARGLMFLTEILLWLTSYFQEWARC